MSSPRSPLLLLCLSALVASTIHPLNGEYLSQSLLRGEWLLAKHSLPTHEQISLFRSQTSWNPANSLADLLVAVTHPYLHESGFFILTFLLLLAGILVLFPIFNRFSARPGFSFILTLFVAFGVAPAISDPSTALGMLLTCVEVALLLSNRLVFLSFLLPFHGLIDGSYILVPMYAPLYGVFRQSVARNFLPTLVASLLALGFGIELALNQQAFSVSCAIISSVLAVLLAVTSTTRRIAFSVVTLLTLLLFGAFQYYLQFPALTFVAPLHIIALWHFSSGSIRTRWAEALIRLETRLQNFLQRKNRVSLYWLAGAFIYFEVATSIFHPVRTESLPGPVMDAFAELRSDDLPIHSPEIGGFVGYRLHAHRGMPSNLIDASPLRFDEIKTFLRYKQLFNCQGDWETEFQRLHPHSVLCKGAEPLCIHLKGSPGWQLKSRTLPPEQTEKFLQQFPPDRAAIFRQKMEREAWFLLELNS